MPATTYLRPELFPFPFSSIPDWSSDPSYARFGTIGDALQSLTNLLTFQVSVSWSFNWRYAVDVTVFPDSYSAGTNLPLFIPAYPSSNNSSWISWYNTDFNGNKRPNPAARVLYGGGATSPIAQTATSIGDPTDYYLTSYLTLNRTGTVTNLAFSLLAINFASANPADHFNAGFESVPADNLATIPLNVMGTSIPFYLRTGGPTAADIVIVGPITFNASVTATFSAV